MKTFPIALASHIASRQTKLATALKVTREDGEVFGFTTHDVSDEVDGVTYSANPGLTVSDIVIAANCAVGNLQIETLHDGSLFTFNDIFGGRWRNASFLIFRYNWSDLDGGNDELLAGTFGELHLQQNKVIVELRDLRDKLQHSVGDASSKNCRYRLGDARCKVDLDGSPNPFVVTGFLTHIASNRVFRDSARTEAADFFGHGEIQFEDGANAGFRMKIRSYDADGTFTLELPFYGTVSLGDTYTAIAGCRKRFVEDCIGKYDNGLNFGGEPHRKGLNSLTARATPNV